MMFSLPKTIAYLLFLVGVCLICFLVFGCSDKSTNQSSKAPNRDSSGPVKVLAVFKSAGTGQAEAGIIKKVFVTDTLSWKMDGSLRQELKYGPDSFYIITYNLPMMDSTGKEMRDSAGRPRFRQQEIPTDKKWVRSGWENLDSAIKELNELK